MNYNLQFSLFYCNISHLVSLARNAEIQTLYIKKCYYSDNYAILIISKHPSFSLCFKREYRPGRRLLHQGNGLWAVWTLLIRERTIENGTIGLRCRRSNHYLFQRLKFDVVMARVGLELMTSPLQKRTLYR